MSFLDQWGFVMAAGVAVIILISRPRWLETLKGRWRKRHERISREYEVVASRLGGRFRVLGICLVVAWAAGAIAGISNVMGSWSESTTTILRWITGLSLVVVVGILGFLYLLRRKSRP